MRLFVSDHLYVDTGSWERRTWFTDSLSSLNNEVENGGFVEENEACLRSHHQLGTGALKLRKFNLENSCEGLDNFWGSPIKIYAIQIRLFCVNIF